MGHVDRGRKLGQGMITLDTVCAHSENILAREIGGEWLILPLGLGIKELDEDEVSTLNETGKAIWERLDGTRALSEIADELAGEYEAPKSEIQQDVICLVTELVRRHMLVVLS